MHAATLRHKFRDLLTLAVETLDGYSRDRGDLLAAALAFYMLLSIAPLVIIAVAIAGLFFGSGTARQELLRFLSETMDSRAAATVGDWADAASRSGKVATLVGLGLVLLAASRLTAQLRSALNQMWNVKPPPTASFWAAVKDYVQRRFVAVLLVVATGPLLILVIVSRALLTGLHDFLFATLPLAGLLVQLLQVLFSVGLVATITALVFRLVPDAKMDWRAIWVGALLTSLLFNAGNVLVGWYLGRATVTAAYGAAGSVIVILLWMYFSAQLFLFGAEFTQVRAQHRGARQQPAASGAPATRAESRMPANERAQRPSI